MTDTANHEVNIEAGRSLLGSAVRFLVMFLALALPFLGVESLTVLMGLLMILFLANRRAYSGLSPAIQKQGLALMLFVIVLIYATVFSVSFVLSVEGFAKFGCGIALMLIMQWVLEKKRDIMLFIQLLIISGTLIGGYGIFQFFFKDTSAYLLLDTELHPDISIRVTSLMQNSNNLASFLVLVIPLVMALFFYKRHWLHKLIALGVFGVLMVCLVMTYSRSAYIGIVIAMGIFVVLVEMRLLLLAPFGVGALILWMPKSLESRISSTINSIVGFLTDPGTIQDTSASYRLYIWSGVGRMIEDFGLYGVGVNNKVFELVYGFYMDTGVIAVHAHSTFLEMILEFGMVGAAVLFGFLIKVLLNSFQMSRGTDSDFVRLFSIAGICSVTGLMVVGAVEHAWYYHKVFYTFFAVMGLLLALYNNDWHSRAGQEE